jgi:hypothetical protein
MSINGILLGIIFNEYVFFVWQIPFLTVYDINTAPSFAPVIVTGFALGLLIVTPL